MGVGYRAPQIMQAVNLWDFHRDFIQNAVQSLPPDQALNTVSRQLRELPGIGPKVAACIQLYGLQQRRLFPVDVWVKRAMLRMSDQYSVPWLGTEPIEEKGMQLFGEDAGYAQQLLFCYARSHRIK